MDDMAKISQRPAANLLRPVGPAWLERVSWDDLRVFAIAGRELSFRKAATTMRTSSSTVARRMERLEEIIGVRLFDRLPEGVALTAEGRSVLAAAQEMERASHSLRAQLDNELARRGVVRCAVTEGLGTFWIVPHLAEIQPRKPSHPGGPALFYGIRRCASNGSRCGDPIDTTRPTRPNCNTIGPTAYLSFCF